MKSTTPKKVSVIKPLLKKLMNQHGANSKVPKQNSKAASAPLKPAGLAQDSGAGHNSDNTSKAKQAGRTSTSAPSRTTQSTSAALCGFPDDPVH
jgi:hypothetical protein